MTLKKPVLHSVDQYIMLDEYKELQLEAELLNEGIFQTAIEKFKLNFDNISKAIKSKNIDGAFKYFKHIPMEKMVSSKKMALDKLSELKSIYTKNITKFKIDETNKLKSALTFLYSTAELIDKKSNLDNDASKNLREMGKLMIIISQGVMTLTVILQILESYFGIIYSMGFEAVLVFNTLSINIFFYGSIIFCIGLVLLLISELMKNDEIN